MVWTTTVVPGSPCGKCGSTEKKRNGYNANTGTPRWTCAICRRRSERAKERRRVGTPTGPEGQPEYVPGGCTCGDRIGDDPRCLEHEDYPLTG